MIAYGTPLTGGVFWVTIDKKGVTHIETQARHDSSIASIEVTKEDIDKVLQSLERAKRYLEITT